MYVEQHATPEIEALSKEIFEKQRQLSELRRAVAPEPVKDFVLRGKGNVDVSLSALFGDKQDLIVSHNMGAKCPYCTLWADGINGLLPHIENRTAFVVVSPDAPDAQAAFAASRGWNYTMASNADSGFTEAMGFTFEKDGQTYMLPGYSTFRKRDDGSIVRIAKTSAGPGDPYCAAWHLFDLLEDGAAGWQPKFRYDGSEGAAVG